MELIVYLRHLLDNNNFLFLFLIFWWSYRLNAAILSLDTTLIVPYLFTQTFWTYYISNCNTQKSLHTFGRLQISGEGSLLQVFQIDLLFPENNTNAKSEYEFFEVNAVFFKTKCLLNIYMYFQGQWH